MSSVWFATGVKPEGVLCAKAGTASNSDDRAVNFIFLTSNIHNDEGSRGEKSISRSSTMLYQSMLIPGLCHIAVIILSVSALRAIGLRPRSVMVIREIIDEALGYLNLTCSRLKGVLIRIPVSPARLVEDTFRHLGKHHVHKASEEP